MATFWIVCAVLSHITQDAWSYRYSRLRHAQKGLQNGEYQMSWNNFNSGFRSMSTCPFGPCEVWDSNSYDHPSSNLLKSHEIRKMSVFIFFAQKNEYWFWLDFYFLFDENLLQTFSHNFLQESNQFQQKCFLLPALANMVSFVSIFWENVMKYVKKRGTFLGYFLVTATSFMKWSIKGFEQFFCGICQILRICGSHQVFCNT